MTTRLAIFDLDGTLIDSVDDIAAAVNHGLARVGLAPRSRDEVRRFVGNGARVLLERAVGPHQDKLEEAITGWREHYQAHLLDQTRPYPGIVEALAGAHRTLAVQTNKPASMTLRILQGLGLLERFAMVLGGGDVPSKPDPAGVRAILERVRARPEDTVFVGDSLVDAETARNAGVTFVGVSWGLVPREELAQGGVVNLVDRAEELAEWLE